MDTRYGYQLLELRILLVDELYKVPQAVFSAIESGYRHIDTAASYASEDLLAQALNDAISCGIVTREEMFITTKMALESNKRKYVVPALKMSFKRLQLDYVDLFLFHTPYNLLRKKKYDLLDIWRGLEDAKKLNLTRSIGVSNFEIEHLVQILPYCTTIPAVNQLEVNPTFTNTELVEYCQEQGIIVTAYGPMGFTVTRPGVNDPPPPSLGDPGLVKIANKYGVRTSQVVLRCLIDRGTIPISRSTNKQHMQSNIDLFKFSLTTEEVERLSGFNVNRTVYGYKRDAIFEDYRLRLLDGNRRNRKLYPLP
ncbi:aldo-keto reductase AKR2E4-like [Maniola hyperantus]|uniref:aldo-keto reductase AKR2E4-like n=1 Tax=Aphantopus hyperantus TaxID=2795564 RepID=UPI00374820D8